MTLEGFGIFSWERDERVSNRYGAFYLDATNFNQDVTVAPQLDDLSDMVDKRVAIRCQVVESRDSGHDGDRALDLWPTRPKVGEVIDLGVGILDIKTVDFAPTAVIVLAPADGRDELWLDPRKLYRLHDQTVRVSITETDAPFTPAPTGIVEAKSGVVAVGDGAFQSKRIKLKEGDRIAPRSHSLGGGAFSLDTDFEDGDKVDIV